MSQKVKTGRNFLKLKKASRVNHPLAKYNSLDQLVCAICNIQIKNEHVWAAHLSSKRHKDVVQNLKSGKSPATQVKPVNCGNALSKNKHLSDEPLSKKTKQELPIGFFDSGRAKQNLPSNFFDTHSEKPKSILKKPLKVQSTPHPKSVLVTTLSKSDPPCLMDNNSNITDNDESKFVKPEPPCNKISNNTSEKSNSGNTISVKPEVNPNKTSSTKTLAIGVPESLPEGFFDDPKKDAKARNVEYVDPKEKEWEDFQKVIQEETKISEEIQDEDDEETAMSKDMLEYNTMKTCLSRVQKVKDSVKEIKIDPSSFMDGPSSSGYNKVTLPKLASSSGSEETITVKEEEKSESEDSSDEDLDDIFDWRAKMA